VSAAAPPTSLVGRTPELELLGGLLDRVRDGGGAVVVRGEAGIGKSALLVEAGRRGSGRGMRVLRAAGVQSEAHLPFSGLHQLLRPILAEVEDLPAPQRAALLAAFGMSEEAAPDLFSSTTWAPSACASRASSARATRSSSGRCR
jgi:predicted ATPase